jgi:cellulose biosynthesis protein BcsQ
LDVPIIAVASAKGGVGKTTSALAIAAAIAMDANAPPVLLWDLDPTGDATLRLGLAIEPQRQLGMLLAGRAAPSDSLGSYGIENATRSSVEQFDVGPRRSTSPTPKRTPPTPSAANSLRSACGNSAPGVRWLSIPRPGCEHC